jgi:hypothetical protein
MRTVNPTLPRYGTDFIATGALVLVVVGCSYAALCNLLIHFFVLVGRALPPAPADCLLNLIARFPAGLCENFRKIPAARFEFLKQYSANLYGMSVAFSIARWRNRNLTA